MDYATIQTPIKEKNVPKKLQKKYKNSHNFCVVVLALYVHSACSHAMSIYIKCIKRSLGQWRLFYTFT